MKNIFPGAVRRIGTVPMTHYRWMGFQVSDTGRQSSEYDDPTIIRVNPQPVGDNTAKNLGLDLQKQHYQCWSKTIVNPAGTGRGCDRIGWNGELWDVISINRWELNRGRWNSFLMVKLQV